MSVNYPDLPNTVFPNSIDTYITYMDEDINSKPYIDQIQTYIANGDFASAQAVMVAHPELQKIIINASVIQKYMDMGIAMERTLSNTVAQIMSLPKYIGDYSTTVPYQMFNCVTKNYIGYMCINPNTPIGTDVSNPTYWVRQSFVGPAGLSLTPFYSYDSTYTYNNVSLVPYGNKFYMSLQNSNLNHQPDTSPDWWKVVFQGATQIITSNSQPTGLDSTQYWYQTNSTDNSFKVMESNGNNSFAQKMPESNANFIKCNDATSVQSFVNQKAQANGLASLDSTGKLVQMPTPIQVGAVQGNTKAWVATAAEWDGANLTYTLTIPGFIYSDGCTITFKAPSAPPSSSASLHEWCSVKINDIYYFLRTIAGNALSGTEWIANAEITVTLSPISIPLSTGDNRGTAFVEISNYADYASNVVASTTAGLRNIVIHSTASSTYLGDNVIELVTG